MCLAVLNRPAIGDWICWTADKSQSIQCAQPDGSRLVDLVVGLATPMGMAVDPINGTLYWTEHDADRIMSLSLDGIARPSINTMLPSLSGLRGMGIALSIGKVYWVAEDLQTIQRANLDGSSVENLSIATGSFFDVAVDDSAGQLYWTSGIQIWRGNLDGSSAVPIIGDAEQPYYLALDLVNGKLYWTDWAANEIGRANLDGTEREIPGPISGLADKPIGITLDTTNGKLFWTSETGSVHRANLDGSQVETIVDNADSTWDIVLLSSIPEKLSNVPALSNWGLLALTLAMLVLSRLYSLRMKYPNCQS